MCGNVKIAEPPKTPPPSKIFNGDELDALLNLQHRFQGGVYTRSGSVKVPADMAGILIIGREWKVDHVFHVAKGNLLLWDKFHGFRHIAGPYSEFSPAGTQRIGWIMDELEIVNIVRCAATNRALAEDEITAPFVEPPGLGEQIKKLIEL